MIQSQSLPKLIEQLHISQQHLHQRLDGFLHDADWRPAPDQWSLREIAAHLAEAEQDCLLKRIRLIATGSHPHFDFYLNSEDDLSQCDMLDSLERWFNTRQAVIRFVQNLSPEQLAYTATHVTFGEITIEDYLREFHKHDEEHLRELEKSLAIG